MNLGKSSSLLTWLIAPVLLTCACATYTSETSGFRADLYRGDPAGALASLDKSPVAKAKSDKLVYLLEKGMALYLGQRYKEATAEWEKASRLIDDLYSVSVSRTAGSFVLNEGITEYEGETHERVLVPVFSAVAYLAENKPNEAIVEARRTAKILEKLNEDNKKKNVFNRDSFAHFLAGIIFEMKGKWDDAIIEYRGALAAAEDNRSWAPRLQLQPIVEALGRLAESRRREDILVPLKKKYANISWKKQSEIDNSGEVLIVYEAGRSPLKRAEDSVIGTPSGVMRISLPVYFNEYYASQGATISVNGKDMGRTEVVEDIGALARQALSDRKPIYIAKLTARAIAKAVLIEQTNRKLGPLAGIGANIAAVVTEVADTRSWTSLPDLISFARIVVPANSDLKIVVSPDLGQPTNVAMRLEPGEKRLIRLRTFQ